MRPEKGFSWANKEHASSIKDLYHSVLSLTPLIMQGAKSHYTFCLSYKPSSSSKLFRVIVPHYCLNKRKEEVRCGIMREAGVPWADHPKLSLLEWPTGKLGLLSQIEQRTKSTESCHSIPLGLVLSRQLHPLPPCSQEKIRTGSCRTK